MPTHGPSLRAGFTLAELVVVLALVVLVAPLVAGSLRNAAEETRIAACLSNLSQLGRATQVYFADFDGQFPCYTVYSGSSGGLCGWQYGGRTASDWWRDHHSGLFFIRATERPLNEYLLGAQVQPDIVEGDTVVRRTPMPMLRCPSDRSSNQRRYGIGTDDDLWAISCYDDVGTSYHYNICLILGTTVGACCSPWNGRAVQLAVRDGFEDRPEEIVWYVEDPVDWGLANGTMEIGNHGAFSQHSIGFLDGHAAYIYMDTRHWCGAGWAALNPKWVRRSGSPSIPIYYTSAGKNCE